MKPWFVVVPAGLLLGCSLLGGQGSTAGVLAPYQWHGKPRDAVQDRLVLYYFGASDCPPCNAPQNIELLKQVKARLPGAHPDLLVKTVLICLDHDFERAREFAAKYGAWDEISVGSVWFNELTQHYLAKSKANVIPHVLELDVIPLSVPERFRLDLREDGESSSVQCSDAILSPSRRLTFTAKDDSTTATGECVLSLDGRRIGLVLTATNWMERTMILDRVAE